MTKEEKRFILGCAIGDGCISKGVIQKKYIRYRFLMKHSSKQSEYFHWKAKKLEQILSKTPRTSYYTIYKNSGYSNITALQYEKCNKKVLKPLYNLLYRNGKKAITRRVLNKLSPLELAIWYMDDGSLSHYSRNGVYTKVHCTLNTYISRECNEIIVKYFQERWGIKWNIHKDKQFTRLAMGTKEFKKFSKIIEPYIHPSMQYKIKLKLKQRIIPKQVEL